MGSDYGAYGEKVSFEAALTRSGFGLYSYIITCFAGFAIISFGCISFGTTIIVPASACELGTTTAQQGFLVGAPVIGLVIGTVIWGYLGDVFGRSTMLLVSFLASSTVNAVASISVNWLMLMVLQFIATLLASGKMSLSMTLLSESVPIAKRNVVVLLVSSIYLMCQGIMAVVAMPIIPLPFSYYLPSLGIYWNSWRTLMVVYSIPSLLSAIWLWCLQESPKFLYSKGRETEALEVLAKIYSINLRKSSAKYDVTGILEESTQKISFSAKQHIIPLFKPPLLKSTLIMTCLFVFQLVSPFLVWLPTIGNQFFRILETGEGNDLSLCEILDLSLQSPPATDLVPCSLNNTALLMVLGVCAILSVVNILLSLVVNRIGRRNIVIGVTLICGGAGLLVNVIPNALGSVLMFILFLIGFGVLGTYMAIAVALFPTSLRAFAVALTSTGGRITSLAAIQVINFLLVNNCTAAFYIFPTLFASSSLVALCLADDRRQPSPQAIGENKEAKEASKL